MTFERFNELAFFWVLFAAVICAIGGFAAAFLQNDLLMCLSIAPLVLMSIFCLVMASLCDERVNGRL